MCSGKIHGFLFIAILVSIQQYKIQNTINSLPQDHHYCPHQVVLLLNLLIAMMGDTYAKVLAVSIIAAAV